MNEAKIKINGETCIWRYNMLTCLTITKMLNIKNPLDIFGMLHERSMDPELVGVLVTAGIKYQPDHNGHFADTGITPLDTLAGMEANPEALRDMVEQIVDAVNAARPTKAGKKRPATEANSEAEPTEETPG